MAKKNDMDHMRALLRHAASSNPSANRASGFTRPTGPDRDPGFTRPAGPNRDTGFTRPVKPFAPLITKKK